MNQLAVRYHELVLHAQAYALCSARYLGQEVVQQELTETFF